MWHELKEAEIRALRDRVAGRLGPESVAELRDLLRQVASDPDASEVICFHGAWALVHEVDQCFDDAARHRALEIEKIERLHELMHGEPAALAAFALQNYRDSDLRLRRDIFSSLRRARGNSPS